MHIWNVQETPGKRGVLPGELASLPGAVNGAGSGAVPAPSTVGASCNVQPGSRCNIRDPGGANGCHGSQRPNNGL